MTKSTAPECELCDCSTDAVLWQDAFCRVVLVDDAAYPGFCRVILARHIREMTDLTSAERTRLMDAVFATEAALRDVLAPDKINLASLGNAVPHLHWHVIPRFRDDAHFPRAIWAEPCRGARARGAPDRDALSRALKLSLG